MKLPIIVMLAMAESRDGSFVGETVIPAAGSGADVHINDGRRWWQRCFGRCCRWRRVICMLLFPGCPAFCTGMCVVLLEPTWLSFLVQAGSPLLKKKKKKELAPYHCWKVRRRALPEPLGSWVSYWMITDIMTEGSEIHVDRHRKSAG